MQGLTHCVHIYVASVYKLNNVIGTLICDPPFYPRIVMPTVKC